MVRAVSSTILREVVRIAVSDINTAIGAAATAGEYKLVVSYEAKKTNGEITIKQSDDSYASIDAILAALRDNGYRASYSGYDETRDFRLNLTIGWS